MLVVIITSLSRCHYIHTLSAAIISCSSDRASNISETVVLNLKLASGAEQFAMVRSHGNF